MLLASSRASWSAPVAGVTGVLVHGSELFICSIDATFQKPSDVKSFALDGTIATAVALPAGTLRGTFTLGANRFCNDMAFDAAGNLYVTDSFSSTVLRLPAGGSALEPGCPARRSTRPSRARSASMASSPPTARCTSPSSTPADCTALRSAPMASPARSPSSPSHQPLPPRRYAPARRPHAARR
jgi:hypothetical protein